MLYKSSKLEGEAVTSSSVYVCGKCGYTEIVTGEIDAKKECVECKEIMGIISSQDASKEDIGTKND